MKKVILTVAALLVSAAMVFSFAGCTDTTVDEDTSVAASEEDSAAPVVEAEESSVLA